MDQFMPGWRRYLLVQPPTIFLLLAMSMSATILTDLMVYRTCMTILKLNETECSILHTNSSSKEALRINSMVQPYVSLIVMGKFFMESVFPSLLTLFLGPWSDKYGRKPVMLLGYISISLTYLLLSIMINLDVIPWYFLIAYIPTALLGGISVLMLSSMCYITDITNDHERGWHLAWLDAMISLGILIGLLSGPIILNTYGYTAVFSIATALCTLAMLYILFLVPETIQSQTSGLNKIFNFSLVKDLINASIKKRDGFDRSLAWCCIVCLIFLLIVFEGNLSIEYLFTCTRLGWTVEKYSIYSATVIVFGIFGAISGIKLLRNYAGFPEAVVAIISIISSFSSVLIRAFTWQSWHMYLSVFLGMFSNMSRPMIRTILSKAIPVEDTGKIFSLATSLETLLPFAAASLYTFLYSHYMPPLYPLPVWFLSTVFLVITIIILIYIQVKMTRSNTSYSPLTADNDVTH